MDTLIAITEAQAKQIERLGLDVQVCYAIPRGTAELFAGLLDGQTLAEKAKSKAKPRKGSRRPAVRTVTVSAQAAGKAAKLSGKTARFAAWVVKNYQPDVPVARMDIAAKARKAGYPELETNWLVRALMDAKVLRPAT